MKKDFLGVIVFLTISIIMLIFTSLIDIEFFKTFVDLSTIFLGLTIYIIVFYSSEYSKGSNLLFVGVAYLAVSIIDLMHMVNGGGFSLLSYDYNASIQFWYGARFIEAFVLFFAYLTLMRKGNLDINVMLASFGATTLFVFGIVSFSEHLPLVYDPVLGYTSYKIVLDVLIITVFILALIMINKNESRKFNKKILILAVSFKIISEFVFIFDSGSTATLEVIRYMSKYISYVLLFVVFSRDLLKRPYENIFRSFKEKEEELLEISKRDSLTGLYNHSNSYEIMRDIIKQNKTEKSEFCLMMIDVDDFKCINDKYGHVKGDEILLEISNIFKNCEGPLKLAGRYGGDEFVVLFVDCNGKKALAIANRIFKKMDELSVKVGIKVTISVGISEWQEGFTAKDLVRSADFQMYEAKSNGKNTVSLKAKSE